MRVWFINAIDAIPGEDFGYTRSLDIANTLKSAGWDVDWIVPSFAHSQKHQRTAASFSSGNEPQVRLHIVPTRAYHRNVSLERLGSYWDFGRGFARLSRSLPRPDAILAVLPTPFLDVAVARAAQRLHVPLIADFRDLWPELFASHLPGLLSAVKPLLLAPWIMMRSYALRRLAAFLPINRAYMEYLRETVPELRTIPSQVIYDGVDPRVVLNRTGHRSNGAEDGEIRAIYSGMLSGHHDIDALLGAAEILASRRSTPPIRVLITGKGPMESAVRERIATSNLKNVTYHGVVPVERLREIYATADIGLITCAPTSTVVMPAKVFDYMGAGLPVISSVAGDCRALVRECQMGIEYIGGDPRSLADAISRLASDSALREAMTRNSAAAGERYARLALYRHFIEQIETAVQRNRHGSAPDAPPARERPGSPSSASA
jgi:glycosyltransferase involved in cell wall biosynthesis